MQRPAKPSTPVRFRPPPPENAAYFDCPDDEIGRHKGLKICVYQRFHDLIQVKYQLVI